MTTRLTYPSADTYAVFPLVDGGDVAIHSRNVAAVLPGKAFTQIQMTNLDVHKVVSTFEVVMQRLSGREAV